MTDSSEKTLDFFLDRLTQNAARYPTKTAVTFLASGPNGGKVESQLTYSQLQEQTSALACRLLQNGLTQGDTAVLVYPPSLDYMVAFLACLKAGIVAVPVFPPNPARPSTLSMFSSICQSSGAKYALTSVSYNHAKKLAGMYPQILDIYITCMHVYGLFDIYSLDNIVGIKESLTKWKRPTTAAWPEDLTWLVTNDTTNNNNKASITLNYTPSRENVAFLQYTSGSTSEPKGVMITHANLAHNLTLILDELSAKDDTVVVSWLPQYHDMGLIGSYLGVLYCGGSGYYLSPLTFLQRPQIWIEAISKYKATHLQAPNFAFALTSRKYSHDDTLDLSSVRHVINAAEPVDEESMDSFVKTFEKHGFPQNVIYPTYGLAEHTVFVCSGGTQRLRVDKQALEVDSVVQICNDDSTKEMTKCVGCGYPKRQGVDVKIVNTTTCQALPEDNVGEIWIQSPSKAAGYFGKPELTKHDFHAQLRSGSTSNANDVLDDINGYLRTGDLGFMHNDELFICGRLKDLIIVGGRNYYPQDLEATAEASSELLRPGCSAAFTIDPTHEGGEQVALVAELRDVPSGKVWYTLFCFVVLLDM
jgi:acyl-CoA synthetase (AMP-forming)/AMP-acid ligase II